jgi:hypothetical protein
MAVFWEVVPCSLVDRTHDEAVSSYETSVNFCNATRGNIMEGNQVHTRRCKNLKSQPDEIVWNVFVNY